MLNFKNKSKITLPNSHGLRWTLMIDWIGLGWIFFNLTMINWIEKTSVPQSNHTHLRGPRHRTSQHRAHAFGKAWRACFQCPPSGALK